jgi:hypothetical protein
MTIDASRGIPGSPLEGLEAVQPYGAATPALPHCATWAEDLATRVAWRPFGYGRVQLAAPIPRFAGFAKLVAAIVAALRTAELDGSVSPAMHSRVAVRTVVRFPAINDPHNSGEKRAVLHHN